MLQESSEMVERKEQYALWILAVAQVAAFVSGYDLWKSLCGNLEKIEDAD